MRAVRIHAHGGPDVLSLDEIPTPEPAEGQVLVRVLAVSINHLDLWVRRGMPGVELPLPLIPGCDGTGEVAALGPGVDGLAVGERVLIEPGYSSGTSKHDLAGNDQLSDDYEVRGEHSDGLDCEYVAIEARYARPLPDGLDPVTTAAAPLVFLTAWGMVVTRAALQAGERVLVLGGASGVGSAAIQIARDLGARVITTASAAKKRQLAFSLGAEECVDPADPDWPSVVRRWSGGAGVDVVVEHVGAATWKGSLRCLARNGRLVTCGATTGPTVSLVLPHLFIKNLSILGSTMGPRAAFATILAKLASGAYRASVDRVLPMSAVAAAHAALENRDVAGKIVLLPGE